MNNIVLTALNIHVAPPELTYMLKEFQTSSRRLQPAWKYRRNRRCNTGQAQAKACGYPNVAVKGRLISISWRSEATIK